MKFFNLIKGFTVIFCKYLGFFFKKVFKNTKLQIKRVFFTQKSVFTKTFANYFINLTQQ